MTPYDWEYPEWECAGMVHDWRNYANCELKEHWQNMPEATKKIVAELLQGIADKDEWE